MNGVAFCLVGIPPCPDAAAALPRDGLDSANQHPRRGSGGANGNSRRGSAANGNPRPVVEGRATRQWAGPRNLLLRKGAECHGFGFTLRHFIVYPPESAIRDEINGNQRGLEPMDTIFVKNVRENGPAHLAGLCTGDRLVKVNGESVLGKTYAQVISLIQNSESVLELSIMPKDEDVLQLAFSHDALRGTVPYVGGAECIPAPPPPCYRSNAPNSPVYSGQTSQDWWSRRPSPTSPLDSRRSPVSPLDNWTEGGVGLARCSSSSSGHTHRRHSNQMWSPPSSGGSAATAQALSDWYYSQTNAHTRPHTHANTHSQRGLRPPTTPPAPRRRPPRHRSASHDRLALHTHVPQHTHTHAPTHTPPHYPPTTPPSPRRRSASTDRLADGRCGRSYSRSEDALQQPGYDYDYGHGSPDWSIEPEGVWPVRSRSESLLLSSSAYRRETRRPLDSRDWQAPPWAASSSNDRRESLPNPAYRGTALQFQHTHTPAYKHSPQQTPEHTPQYYGQATQHTPQHTPAHTPQHTPQYYGQQQYGTQNTPKSPPQYYRHTSQHTHTPQHTPQSPPQIYGNTPQNTHTPQYTSQHTPQHTQQNRHTPESRTQQTIASVTMVTPDHTPPLQRPAPLVLWSDSQGYRSYSPSFHRKTGRLLQQRSFSHAPFTWSPPLDQSPEPVPILDQSAEPVPPPDQSPDPVFSDLPVEGQPSNQQPAGQEEPEPEVVMRQKPPGGRKPHHALHLHLSEATMEALQLSDVALGLGPALASADQSAADARHGNESASAPLHTSAGTSPAADDCLATIPFIDEPTSPSVDLRARLVSASSVVCPAPSEHITPVGPTPTEPRSPVADAPSTDPVPSTSFTSLLSRKLHLSHYSMKTSRRSSYLLAVTATRSKSCDEGLNMMREERALANQPKRTKSFFTDEPLCDGGSKRHSASELESGYTESWREGWLQYKLLTVEGNKKVASGMRPWRRVYAVLRSHSLFLYKDKREAVLGGGTGEDEQPINIAGCLVDIAYSETRRRNVLRLSTQDYSEHLLQAEHREDMLTWVTHIRENSRTDNEELLSFSKQALINKKLNDYRKQSVVGKPDSSPRLSRMKPPFLKTDSPSSPRSPKSDSKDESPPKSPWGISLMKRGQRRVNAPKAFGVRLDECQPATTNKYVPMIVEMCVCVMESSGLDTTGIYRVPGNNAAVSGLQEALDRGADINTQDERWQDLNVVSSLLKSFFRKLPEPLFTDDKYSEFIEANRMEDASGRLRKMKSLIHDLPDHHFYTLKFLLRHLKTVAEHADKNKMEPRNLALVFGPTLVRMSEDNMMDMVTHMPDRYKIVETLLQHYEWFFSEDTEKEEKTPEGSDDVHQPPVPNIDHLLSNIGRTATSTDPSEPNFSESPKSKGAWAAPEVLMMSVMSAVTKRRRGRQPASALSIDEDSDLQPITACISPDLPAPKAEDPAPKAEGEEEEDDDEEDDDECVSVDDDECDEDDDDVDDDDDDGGRDDDEKSASVAEELSPVVTAVAKGGNTRSGDNKHPPTHTHASSPTRKHSSTLSSSSDTTSTHTSPTPTHTSAAHPSTPRLQSRPSFSSYRLMQCDTLARKRQKGGLRAKRPPELRSLSLDSIGQPGPSPLSPLDSPGGSSRSPRLSSDTDSLSPSPITPLSAPSYAFTPPHTPTRTHTLPDDATSHSDLFTMNTPDSHTPLTDTADTHTHVMDTADAHTLSTDKPNTHTQDGQHTPSHSHIPLGNAQHTHTNSQSAPQHTRRSSEDTQSHSHTPSEDAPDDAHSENPQQPANSHTHSVTENQLTHSEDSTDTHSRSHKSSEDPAHTHSEDPQHTHSLTHTADPQHTHPDNSQHTQSADLQQTQSESPQNADAADSQHTDSENPQHTHSVDSQQTDAGNTQHTHSPTHTADPQHTHSEAAAFSPGLASGRGLAGSAEELRPMGLRTQLSPETRRRRRAWRRHTVVTTPTEMSVGRGNKPALVTPPAPPTDATMATSPLHTSRLHQFL
ncbi:rho GTPase-activating protein 23-like [Engraulis encrasicolus]|uniref:rho GTPase-activating protein 23-like n=1 Tax=Engraulis encrasicolus TaxID=184585 RepID=UPI002FD14CE0